MLPKLRRSASLSIVSKFSLPSSHFLPFLHILLSSLLSLRVSLLHILFSSHFFSFSLLLSHLFTFLFHFLSVSFFLLVLFFFSFLPFYFHLISSLFFRFHLFFFSRKTSSSRSGRRCFWFSPLCSPRPSSRERCQSFHNTLLISSLCLYI